MKFVCDRCLTKYSIADEKVRGKVLKVRCKNCSNVVTVKETPAVPGPAVADAESDRTVINSRPHAVSALAAAAVAAAPRTMRPTPAPSPALARAGESGRIAAAPSARPSVPAPPKAPTPTPVSEPHDDVQWFLALEGVQKGPFSRKVLVDRLLALPRSADVHVWNEGLDGWKPPRQVPEVAQELRQRPAAPPPLPPRLSPNLSSSVSSNVSSNVSSASAPPAHRPPSGTPAAGSGGRGLGAGTSSPSLSMQLDAVPARRATNGHSGAVAVPAGGGSDVLNLLNLGAPMRTEADAAGGLVSSPVVPGGTAAHVAQMQAEVRAKGPRLALAAAFIGIVGVSVFALYNFVLVKKPAPAPVAQKIESAPGESPSKEAPAGAKTAGDSIKDSTKENKEAVGEEPGKDSAAAILAGRAEPSSVKVVGPSPSKKPGHGRSSRLQGATSLEPAPFSPTASMTAEQQAAAARFGDTQRRVVPIHGGGSSGGHGGPDQGEITRVVNNNKGGIKICYQRALLRDSSLTRGKIDVQISVGLSGRVKKVSIDGPASFRVLDPCIREVIGRWVFPPSSDEYETQFSSSFQGNE